MGVGTGVAVGMHTSVASHLVVVLEISQNPEERRADGLTLSTVLNTEMWSIHKQKGVSRKLAARS